MGYAVGERKDSAVACASLQVRRRGVGGEMLVTSNSVSLNSTVAVRGRLASQIISRTSLGSLKNDVKVDMVVVVVNWLE